MWGRQWSGDPGEQALRGWPWGQWAVHSQGLPHRDAHPQLVPLHPAQGSSARRGGVLECLSLHKDKVKLGKMSTALLLCQTEGLMSLSGSGISFSSEILQSNQSSPKIPVQCLISRVCLG